MRLIVVGAGITGLSAAYIAGRQGHSVQVFESSPDVGGFCGSFPVHGSQTLEKYYHHLFCGHAALIDLLNELGMGSSVAFSPAKMGFLSNGRIYPFAGIRDLLCFTPLRMLDRFRLGLSSIEMMRVRDWKLLEGRSALEWLRMRSGKEACRVVWEPLLRMKFGDNYDRISAAWIWNRVVDRKTKKSASRSDLLGYIDGGYKHLFDRLYEEITKNGGEIHTSMPVEKIIVDGGECRGVSSGGSRYESDAVLATVAVPHFMHLTPDLPPSYVNSLRAILYQGSTCVVLKLKRRLSPYYWTNVSDPQSPFVGIIEHTNLVSPAEYGGRHIVYLTRYSADNDAIFAKSPEEIYLEFQSHLGKIFPDFNSTDVEQYWVFKDRHSQPVFVRVYSRIMPENATPVRNLFILNTAHFYPESRCLNSSVIKAEQVVREIIARASDEMSKARHGA